MKRYRHWVIAGVACALLAAQAFAQAPKQDETWARWKFLIGDWIGVGSGEPGKGAGRFSFAPDLDGKILVRKSFSEYPPKPGDKTGLRHEDLMIVYQSPEDSGFRAVYFDNEGHVIHYAVTFPAKQPSALFESEQKPGALRYRLEYEMESNSQVQITFSIALPGQPYKVYIQGKSIRNN